MEIGKPVIALGLGIALLGLILTYAPGLVRWFGRLPGDVAYEGSTVKVYFPVVSMLIVSVVISLLVMLMRRL